ncbi:BA14K family protein [Microvirga alba]|uniref:Lectin-like protein BA14k n=1 Tax=Microvirga alba TaxID=2791025 RepID=A0A931FP64_9HYPH|nr:BA14K family protein [Microvirga alba]MBF9233122.1 BA14K family protein [Microvirga alba]
MRKAILTTLAAAALGSVSLLAAAASVEARPLSSDDLAALTQKADYTQYRVHHVRAHRVVHHRVAMHRVVVHRRVAMHRGHFVTYRRTVMTPRGRVFVATRRVWVGPRVAASSWRWRYPAYYASTWSPGYNVVTTGSIARVPPAWSGGEVLTTGSIARQTPRQYFSPMNQLGYEYGFVPGLGYLNTSLSPAVSGSIGAVTGPVVTGPETTGSIGLTTGAVGYGFARGSEFPQWAGQTWISYCSRRFPTYDRISDTFWGPDGQRHLCF